MGFSINNSVPALTVFLQGLFSFFSPCVLPLVPLYVSYLAGGAKTVDADGNIRYPRGRILVNTVFFVLGISFAFFLLGFGFTTLGRFFGQNQILFARISGIIMILFGLYQLGVFGHSSVLDRERRLPFLLDRFAMGPIPALLLGFTFSFAWTPCVGPTLGSVLLMAGSASSSAKAFLLIGIYTIGFILPFLAVGLFTGTVLEFFKKHQSVVQYTIKISAVLLIFMGVMTLTGFLNGITGYLSGFGGPDVSGNPVATQEEASDVEEASSAEEESSDIEEASDMEEESSDMAESQETPVNVPQSSQAADPTEPETIPAPDFTLTDQFGNEHSLSDYAGKTIFLNFWATWCSPCRREMPDIQQLYEDYGCNEEDLVVLGVAGPNIGREGGVEDITAFLEENEFDFPVLMDEDGLLFYQYAIQSFPTTFMITKEGNVFGYVPGAMSREIMDSIIDQTMRMERD